jgi:Arc/MetJ family transcription regulator
MEMQYYMYVRTTLELPDVLVNEAMSLTKIPTKTEMVKFALENVIRREKIKELTDYFGKLDLDIDIDKLRNR